MATEDLPLAPSLERLRSLAEQGPAAFYGDDPTSVLRTASLGGIIPGMLLDREEPPVSGGAEHLAALALQPAALLPALEPQLRLAQQVQHLERQPPQPNKLPPETEPSSPVEVAEVAAGMPTLRRQLQAAMEREAGHLQQARGEGVRGWGGG